MCLEWVYFFLPRRICKCIPLIIIYMHQFFWQLYQMIDHVCMIKIYIKKNKTSFIGPNNQVPDKSHSFNTYVEINIGVCTI